MRILKLENLPKMTIRWVDRDIIMLHACFQILQDCVDKENVDTHSCYKEHKESIDEIRALYKWWQIRKSDVNSDDSKDDEMLIRLMKIRKFLWT